MAETFRVFLTSLQINLCTKMKVLLARSVSTFQLIPTHQSIFQNFGPYFHKLTLRFTAASSQANVECVVTDAVVFHLFESARSANSISILKQFQNPNRVRIKAPSWLRNLKARFPLGAAIVNRRLRFVQRLTTSC